jgi:hypothetical protein
MPKTRKRRKLFEHLSEEQAALAEYMSGLSEEAFRARWMTDIEYLLWSAVSGNTEGMRWSLKAEDVAKLRELSQECAGWIAHDSDTLRWVPREEWEARYARHQEGRNLRIGGRPYSKEEYEADLEALRRSIRESRRRSREAQREFDEAVEEFYDALGFSASDREFGLLRHWQRRPVFMDVVIGVCEDLLDPEMQAMLSDCPREVVVKILGRLRL